MRLIDEQYLKTPFYGSRSMTTISIAGLPCQPQSHPATHAPDGSGSDLSQAHTSRKHPGHKVYPYLLRDLSIVHPNQVWAADITYIP